MKSGRKLKEAPNSLIGWANSEGGVVFDKSLRSYSNTRQTGSSHLDDEEEPGRSNSISLDDETINVPLFRETKEGRGKMSDKVVEVELTVSDRLLSDPRHTKALTMAGLRDQLDDFIAKKISGIASAERVPGFSVIPGVVNVTVKDAEKVLKTYVENFIRILLHEHKR